MLTRHVKFSLLLLLLFPQTCVITPDEGVEEGQEPASPQPANDDTGKL